MALDLPAIEARAAAATEGPWHHDKKSEPNTYLRHEGVGCPIATFSTLPGIKARSGPTSATKLDKCNGVIEFHRLTEVLTLACKEDAWKTLV